MAKSSGGRTFLLMLVVAVGVGLLIRFKCNRSEDKPAPKVAVATVTADAAIVEPPPTDAAAIAEPDPEPVEPAKPRYDGPSLEIGALSADGARALLVTLETNMPQLRVVVIDSGKVETDVELAALAEMEDPKDEKVLGDLVRARAVLREFPLGTHRFSRVASTADGTRGAFNFGDPLHLVDGDKLGAKLALPAAYDPMITPDGMLLMRGYDGRIDDEGKYSLFWVPVTGGKPKKIAGTDGLIGRWALKGDRLRVVVSQLPSIPTCVLDIPLTKPYRVAAKVCPEDAEYDDIVLSPSGDWIAWTTEFSGHRRIRSMELATSRVDMDVEQNGNVAISDDGHVAISTYDTVQVWDPSSKSLAASKANIDHRCVFRTATELVCPERGGVRVERL